MKNKKNKVTNKAADDLIKDSNDNNNLDVLNINQDYAKKFEHMRKRQELEKAEAKFGKDALRCTIYY